MIGTQMIARTMGVRSEGTEAVLLEFGLLDAVLVAPESCFFGLKNLLGNC
jgi:hypothetical protein